MTKLIDISSQRVLVLATNLGKNVYIFKKSVRFWREIFENKVESKKNGLMDIFWNFWWPPGLTPGLKENLRFFVSFFFNIFYSSIYYTARRRREKNDIFFPKILCNCWQKFLTTLRLDPDLKKKRWCRCRTKKSVN